MERSRAIELLTQHQDRILAAIMRAGEIVDTNAGDASVQLARLRWETMRLLREYQLFKHGEIFDPVIAGGSAREVAAAKAMKARCIEAGQRYDEHVRRWSMADVPADWAGYTNALLAMTGALREHLSAEREGVSALLTARPRTRTAAPASAPVR